MQIFLLRHGIAEETSSRGDPERQLTADGRQKVKDVIKAAARAGVSPDLCLSSPYRRAMETANIAAEVFKYKGPLLETSVLTPDSDVRSVWEEIRVHRDAGSLLLVGHDPLFSSLAGYLLGVPELNVDFKKGALLAIEIPSFGAQPRGILRWMLTARLAA